jgi:hypothetical protein
LSGRRTERVYPTVYDRHLDAMPASWRRENQDRVDYIIVERDGVNGEEQAAGFRKDKPTPTVARMSRRSRARRQLIDRGDDSDSEDEIEHVIEEVDLTLTNRPFTIPSATPVRLISVAWCSTCG